MRVAKALDIYSRAMRQLIETFVLAGTLATKMQDSADYADRGGFTLPIEPPQAGYLDVTNPESGLCLLIRDAVDTKILSGEEKWLRDVAWRQ